MRKVLFGAMFYVIIAVIFCAFLPTAQGQTVYFPTKTIGCDANYCNFKYVTPYGVKRVDFYYWNWSLGSNYQGSSSGYSNLNQYEFKVPMSSLGNSASYYYNFILIDTNGNPFKDAPSAFMTPAAPTYVFSGVNYDAASDPNNYIFNFNISPTPNSVGFSYQLGGSGSWIGGQALTSPSNGQFKVPRAILMPAPQTTSSCKLL